MRAQNLKITIFNICTLLWIHVRAIDYVIVFDRMENIKGDNEDFVDFSELKIVRRGSNYFINGTYAFLDDLDDYFSLEITTAYSPLGNSRFIKQPFQIERRPMCLFYNTTYRKHIEPSFIGCTNFPVVPAEGLCPIPKGRFYIKDAILAEENLPSYLGRGLWKAEQRIFKGKNCVGGVRLFAHIKDKN